MKKLFIIATAVWLFLYWHKLAVAFKAPGMGDIVGPSITVISFNSNEELIDKLRRVKAGEKIELRPSVTTPTQFRCVLSSAKAAYAEEAKRKDEAEQQTIIAELARIHGTSQ